MTDTLSQALESAKEAIESVAEEVANSLTSDASKVATFMQPIIANIVAAGKTDLLNNIVVDLPAATAAYVSGGFSAALAYVTSIITPQLLADGEQLLQSTITAISAAIVANIESSQTNPGTGGTGGSTQGTQA